MKTCVLKEQMYLEIRVFNIYRKITYQAHYMYNILQKSEYYAIPNI